MGLEELSAAGLKPDDAKAAMENGCGGAVAADLRHCATSGLARFMPFAPERGGARVHRDGRYGVADPGAYEAPPVAGDEDSGAHSDVAWKANPLRDAVPRLWSLAVISRRTPGIESVVRSMQQEGLALSRSLPFVAALARMISLPAHRHSVVAVSNMSPFEWDQKAWSRENVFASEGLALDPGNAVWGAALWGLMVVTEAVRESPRYRCVCTGGSSRGCFIYIYICILDAYEFIHHTCSCAF